MYKIAHTPLLNIEETEDFAVSCTPQQFYDDHPELHGKEIILQLNGGDYLCRDTEWETYQPAHDDILLFQVHPVHAGSNILAFVLQMALKTFATKFIAYYALTGIYATIAKAAIIMIGGALINQLLPKPRKPTPQTIPDPSPTYSLGTSINRVRQGEPVPNRYGSGWCTPDLLQQYYEYDDGEQHINLLFLVGVGKYALPHAKFLDTNITNLSDYSINYVAPNQARSLLPASVYTASGVSSGDVLQAWSASAISNPPATTVTQLAFDYVLPRGLASVSNSGTFNNHSVTIEWQARPVDDAGNPTGTWVTVASKTITDNTNNSLRGSVRAGVSAGRYEVQSRRTNAPSTSSQVFDNITWGGLRGYNYEYVDHGNCTLIEFTMKVTEGDTRLIASDTLQSFQVFYERYLDVWDGSNWINQKSRSIIWALYDAYTAQYAGRKNPASVPLDEWLEFDTKLNTLKHYFDFSFDQQMQLGEALEHIALCGRMKVYQQGGYVRLWRDEEKTLIRHTFTPENTSDFTLNGSFATVDAPTGVVCNYRDKVTGDPARAVFTPNGDESNLASMNLTGCESAHHALDEATYRYHANSRNETGSFRTGSEGAVVSLGDLIAVPQDDTSINQWGHVVYQVGNTITLSNPHGLAQNETAIIAINDNFNKPHFIDITAGADANTVVLASIPAELTIRHGYSNIEPSWYILGTVDHPILQAHVTHVTGKKGSDWVTIEFTVRGEIYTQPVAPPTNDPVITIPSQDLTISDIALNVEPDGNQFVCEFTWLEKPDAEYYTFEINQGGSYRQAFNGTRPTTFQRLPAGTVQVRVAAVGQVQGAYYLEEFTIGSASNSVPLPPPTAFGLSGNFVGSTLSLTWDVVATAQSYQLAFYDNVTGILKRTVPVTGGSFEYTHEMGLVDNIGRDIKVRLFSVDAGGNVSASYIEITQKNPQLPALSNIQVTGFIDTVLVTYDWVNESDIEGVIVYASQTQGFTPAPNNIVTESRNSTASFRVGTGETWYVRLAAFDVWGKDELIFSAEYTATASFIESTQIGLNSIQTGHLATNAVTADKVNVNELSALTANIGHLKSANSGQRFEKKGCGERYYYADGSIAMKFGELNDTTWNNC